MDYLQMEQFNPTNMKASANYRLNQGIDVLPSAHDQCVASVCFEMFKHICT